MVKNVSFTETSVNSLFHGKKKKKPIHRTFSNKINLLFTQHVPHSHCSVKVQLNIGFNKSNGSYQSLKVWTWINWRCEVYTFNDAWLLFITMVSIWETHCAATRTLCVETVNVRLWNIFLCIPSEHTYSANVQLYGNETGLKAICFTRIILMVNLLLTSMLFDTFQLSHILLGFLSQTEKHLAHWETSPGWMKLKTVCVISVGIGVEATENVPYFLHEIFFVKAVLHNNMHHVNCIHWLDSPNNWWKQANISTIADK